ncbi:hypothetical protein [Corynebacterium epidermidicanis]|uniref:Uncharacterized protein n=1 Tax=Corynebacterium epidermidicanis TaxID=1050174 RepID=A0A0G3GUB7_9CORY|nr:hypothetical protein [Corynebacterium epidermidicanis]AKK02477.1 hypothetical protein CEPID_02985 [Corynebacterium epidermidicanis]
MAIRQSGDFVQIIIMLRLKEEFTGFVGYDFWDHNVWSFPTSPELEYARSFSAYCLMGDPLVLQVSRDFPDEIARHSTWADISHQLKFSEVLEDRSFTIFQVG